MTSRARQHANEETPDSNNPPADNATPASTPSDDASDTDVFLIIAKHRDGRVTHEFHTSETAQSYVSSLTYNSRQHRQECERDDIELPEGGGQHEINRRDIRVLKLNTTEITKF